jgi:hypothetical protein
MSLLRPPRTQSSMLLKAPFSGGCMAVRERVAAIRRAFHHELVDGSVV